MVGCIVQAQMPQLLPMPQKVSFTGRYVKAGVLVHEVLVPEVPGAEFQDEAYHLTVGRDGVTIEAVTRQGLYWGRQTVGQLAVSRRGRKCLPQCEITDWPAFRMRGFMHDTGRSFIPLDELKHEIALLSSFKVNVFHWHLTENQAWRLESRHYPQLNAAQNMLREQGKFYTLDEARELVNFCREHHVLLIPEIDMPGHSAAFERTFGFGMQTAEGKRIMKDIIAEVCDALKVPYLHIGTDEVSFTDPGFVPEMVSFVRSRGKKVISWNPGWRYKPGEIDMTQLWSNFGKAQPGIPAIDCRFHYANHFDNVRSNAAASMTSRRAAPTWQAASSPSGTTAISTTHGSCSTRTTSIPTCSRWPSVPGEAAAGGISTERPHCCGTMRRSRRLSLPSLKTVCSGTPSIL